MRNKKKIAQRVVVVAVVGHVNDWIFVQGKEASDNNSSGYERVRDEARRRGSFIGMKSRDKF